MGMRIVEKYKIFVSNEYGVSESFYCDSKWQADLLFNMAKNSGMFDYVGLSEVYEELVLKKEWLSDDNKNDV